MTTFYEKVDDKFVPVAESDVAESFPRGSHLVTVKPGVTSYVYNVDPEVAAVTAALELYTNEIAGIIYDSVQARPREPLTEEELREFEKFDQKTGGKLKVMTIESGREVAKKIADFVANELRESLKNPSVEAANENLKTIMKIVKS